MGRRVAVLVVAVAAIVGACGGQSETAGTSATTGSSARVTAATSAPATSPPTTQLPPTTLAPTTTLATTTTTTVLGEPEPIRIDQAAAGEGQWKVVASLSGGPVLWTTAVRPIPGNRSLLMYVAAFDQSRLHAALFNSTVLNTAKPPQRGTWINNERVPEALAPALVAAFNSGFMLRHIKGGYFSEGKEPKPLIDGQMTVAIDREGRLSIGEYGTDLTNDGTYIALRQNLPPVLRNGKPVVAESPRTYWGDQSGDTKVFRSGLCTLADGRLAYVATRPMAIEQFAQGLVAIGCQLAMQLDVNFNHVYFASFEQSGTAPPAAKVLDPWMLYGDRVLRRTNMDFVALFDPSALEPGVLA